MLIQGFKFIMAVLVVVSVFDNCCKRLLLDWTLWEADNKWEIEEFFHEVNPVAISLNGLESSVVAS